MDAELAKGTITRNTDGKYRMYRIDDCNAVIPPGKPIKLVIWDLYRTLRRGTTRGAQQAAQRAAACALIPMLDRHGLLQSMVSRDEPQQAAARLQRLGLWQYFLYPQIGRDAEPQGIERIAEALNVRLDAVLLIGEQVFERNELLRRYPRVRAVAADALERLVDDPLLRSSLGAGEARPRRLVYLEDRVRNENRRAFAGSKEDFLATLDTRLTLTMAAASDVQRMQELVARPNQLGASYSSEQLQRSLRSADDVFLMVSLQDRFGDCGQVGLVSLGVAPGCWTLNLLLFSCRVAASGVDALVLNYLLRQARRAHVRLLARFRATARNEPLLLFYRSAGFEQVHAQGSLIVLAHDLASIPAQPHWVRLDCEWPQSDRGAIS